MSFFNSNPFALIPSRNVDPFESFDNNFDSYFNSFPFLRNANSLQASSNGLSSVPPLDLEEHKKGYKLKLSIPGVAPSDLIVDFDTVENTLHIKGETASSKTEPTEEGSSQKRITERYSGAFERTIKFPSKIKIDDDNINASLINGVLILKIPKVTPDETQKAKPKRISVEGDANSKSIKN
ncbi:hypothetical protein D0Z03_000276 [Geotrichum reessii]|nr:hypothetical protein D0Z03_000276 [Galactomyces reessii]